LKKKEVCALIQKIGVIPAIRVSSAEDARFAAEAVTTGGIPIVEITMTSPGALELIAYLVRQAKELLVGAGTVLDTETARRCIDAGAGFLTSPGFDRDVVEFAVKHDVASLPGAFTPSEVFAAWHAGGDFVKVFPCAQAGGDSYIKALRAPFPQIPLVAAGGVNQQNALHFILAGANAIGVGTELIPKEAIERREAERICELAHRFRKFVNDGRQRLAGQSQPPVARR
jgi:2-dehydro-3-deoxyphosphogluconate aldolase / (4S)-4-hydroxy-2-oxoglutarate aldolase